MDTLTKGLEPLQHGFHQSVAYLTDMLRFQSVSEKLSKLPLLLPEFMRRRGGNGGVQWQYIRQYSLPLTSRRLIVGVVLVGSAIVGIYVVRRHTRRHYRRSSLSSVKSSGPKGARHRRKRSGSVNSSVLDSSVSSSQATSRTASMMRIGSITSPSQLPNAPGNGESPQSTPRRIAKRGISGSGIGGGGVGSVIRSHSATSQRSTTSTVVIHNESPTSAKSITNNSPRSGTNNKAYISGIDFFQSTETSPMPTPRGSAFTVTHTTTNNTLNVMAGSSSETTSPRGVVGGSVPPLPKLKSSGSSSEGGGSSSSTLGSPVPLDRTKASPNDEVTKTLPHLNTVDTKEKGKASSSPSSPSTPRRVASTIVHLLRRASDKLQATDATNEQYKQQCIDERNAKDKKEAGVNGDKKSTASSATSIPPLKALPILSLKSAASPSEGEEGGTEGSPPQSSDKSPASLAHDPASAFRVVDADKGIATEKKHESAAATNIEDAAEAKAPMEAETKVPEGQKTPPGKGTIDGGGGAGPHTTERRRLIAVASDFLERMSNSDESDASGILKVSPRVPQPDDVLIPTKTASPEEENKSVADIDIDTSQNASTEVPAATATAPASPDKTTPPRERSGEEANGIENASIFLETISPPGLPTDHTPPPSMSANPPVEDTTTPVRAISANTDDEPDSHLNISPTTSALASLLKGRRTHSVGQTAPIASTPPVSTLSREETEGNGNAADEEGPSRVVSFFKGRRKTEVYNDDCLPTPSKNSTLSSRLSEMLAQRASHKREEANEETSKVVDREEESNTPPLPECTVRFATPMTSLSEKDAFGTPTPSSSPATPFSQSPSAKLAIAAIEKTRKETVENASTIEEEEAVAPNNQPDTLPEARESPPINSSTTEASNYPASTRIEEQHQETAVEEQRQEEDEENQSQLHTAKSAIAAIMRNRADNKDDAIKVSNEECKLESTTSPTKASIDASSEAAKDVTLLTSEARLCSAKSAISAILLNRKGHKDEAVDEHLSDKSHPISSSKLKDEEEISPPPTLHTAKSAIAAIINSKKAQGGSNINKGDAQTEPNRISDDQPPKDCEDQKDLKHSNCSTTTAESRPDNPKNHVHTQGKSAIAAVLLTRKATQLQPSSQERNEDYIDTSEGNTKDRSDVNQTSAQYTPRTNESHTAKSAIAAVMKNRSGNDAKSNAVKESASPVKEVTQDSSENKTEIHNKDDASDIQTVESLPTTAQSALAAVLQRRIGLSNKEAQPVANEIQDAKKYTLEESKPIIDELPQEAVDTTVASSGTDGEPDPNLQASVTDVEYYTDETLWMALGTVAQRQRLWLKKQAEARNSLEVRETRSRSLIESEAFQITSTDSEVTSPESLYSQLREGVRSILLRVALRTKFEARKKAEEAARLVAEKERERQQIIEAAAQKAREEQEARMRAEEDAERRRAAIEDEEKLATIRKEEHSATLSRIRSLEDAYNRQAIAAAESQRGTTDLIRHFTSQMTATAMGLLHAQQRQAVALEYEHGMSEIKANEAAAWTRVVRWVDYVLSAAERQRAEQYQREQLNFVIQQRFEEEEAQRRRWAAAEVATEKAKSQQAQLSAKQIQDLEDARLAKIEVAQKELTLARSHLSQITQAAAEAELAKSKAKQESELYTKKANDARNEAEAAQTEAVAKQRAVADKIVEAAAEAAVAAVATTQKEWAHALAPPTEAHQQLATVAASASAILASQQEQLKKASDVAEAAAQAATSVVEAAQTTATFMRQQHEEHQSLLQQQQTFFQQQMTSLSEQQQKLLIQSVQHSTTNSSSSPSATKEGDEAKKDLKNTPAASPAPLNAQQLQQQEPIPFQLKARLGLCFPSFLPDKWGPVDSSLIDPTLCTIIIELPQSTLGSTSPEGASSGGDKPHHPQAPLLMGSGKNTAAPPKPSGSAVHDLHGSTTAPQTFTTNNSSSDNTGITALTTPTTTSTATTPSALSSNILVNSRVIIMAHDLAAAEAGMQPTISASNFCRSSIQSMVASEGAALSHFADGPADLLKDPPPVVAGAPRQQHQQHVIGSGGGMFEWYANVEFNKGERFIEAFFTVYERIGYAIMLSNTLVTASDNTCNKVERVEVATGAPVVEAENLKRNSSASVYTVNDPNTTATQSSKGPDAAQKATVHYGHILSQFRQFARMITLDSSYFGTSLKPPTTLDGAIRYFLPLERTITLPLTWRVIGNTNSLPMTIVVSNEDNGTPARGGQQDGLNKEHRATDCHLTLSSIDAVGKRVQSLEMSLASDELPVPAEVIQRVMRTATVGGRPSQLLPAEASIDHRVYEGSHISFALPPPSWSFVRNTKIAEHRLGHFSTLLTLDLQPPSGFPPTAAPPQVICHMAIISHPTDHPLVEGLLKHLGSPGLAPGSTLKDCRWVRAIPLTSDPHQQGEGGMGMPFELHVLSSSHKAAGQWLLQYWVITPWAVSLALATAAPHPSSSDIASMATPIDTILSH